jgi:NADPH2:quinone reductase
VRAIQISEAGGPDVLTLGRTTFDASLAALRRRGLLVLFGASSGPVPPVDPQRLNAAGSVYFTRPKLVDHIVTPAELAARAGAVYAEVAAGTLDIRIGGRYPLADARAAHEDLQSRRTTGKLLLLP